MNPLFIVYIAIILIVSGSWIRDVYREHHGE
jgi:hypothetical protein